MSHMSFINKQTSLPVGSQLPIGKHQGSHVLCAVSFTGLLVLPIFQCGDQQTPLTNNSFTLPGIWAARDLSRFLSKYATED